MRTKKKRITNFLCFTRTYWLSFSTVATITTSQNKLNGSENESESDVDVRTAGCLSDVGMMIHFFCFFLFFSKV